MSFINWQFSLDEVTFGKGTPYAVTAFDHEKPEARVQDQPRPRGDGILFGKDEMGGTVFNVEIDVQGADDAEALDLLAALRLAWQGDAVRSTPGATQVLTYRMPGRDRRRVFGRAREFSPATLKDAALGFIPVVAQFQARDHLFYDDAETSLILTQVPPSSSGLVAPLVEPLTTEHFGERPRFLTNTGDAATLPRVRFHGPSAQPSLTLTATGEVMKLNLTILDGEFVEVDCLTKTVLRNGTANVAGKLTRPSTFFELPAGTSELRYAAVDNTATSFAEVLFRSAHLSL